MNLNRRKFGLLSSAAVFASTLHFSTFGVAHAAVIAPKSEVDIALQIATRLEFSLKEQTELFEAYSDNVRSQADLKEQLNLLVQSDEESDEHAKDRTQPLLEIGHHLHRRCGNDQLAQLELLGRPQDLVGGKSFREVMIGGSAYGLDLVAQLLESEYSF